MRGNAKTAHINVRMTEEERAAIMARSSAFGMAPSTLMRECALLVNKKPVRVADEAILRQILREIKGQGNNLNQAVRAINAYGVDKQTSRQLLQAVDLVSRTASQLSNLTAKSQERP